MASLAATYLLFSLLYLFYPSLCTFGILSMKIDYPIWRLYQETPISINSSWPVRCCMFITTCRDPGTSLSKGKLLYQLKDLATCNAQFYNTSEAVTFIKSWKEGAPCLDSPLNTLNTEPSSSNDKNSRLNDLKNCPIGNYRIILLQQCWCE